MNCINGPLCGYSTGRCVYGCHKVDPDGFNAARGIFWWAVLPLLAGIGVIAWLYL